MPVTENARPKRLRPKRPDRIGQTESARPKSPVPTGSDLSISTSTSTLLHSIWCIYEHSLQAKAGVGNLWLASQMWLFWWRHLARLIFS